MPVLKKDIADNGSIHLSHFMLCFGLYTEGVYNGKQEGSVVVGQRYVKTVMCQIFQFIVLQKLTPTVCGSQKKMESFRESEKE